LQQILDQKQFNESHDNGIEFLIIEACLKWPESSPRSRNFWFVQYAREMVWWVFCDQSTTYGPQTKHQMIPGYQIYRKWIAGLRRTSRECENNADSSLAIICVDKQSVHPVYIKSVHRVYIECISSVHRVYIKRVHRVYIKCTSSVHRVYIKSVYRVYIRSVHRVHIRSAHRVYIKSVHRVYIKCTSSVHRVYIKRTSSVHQKCTSSVH
jgi:hypothetical protein